MFEVFVSDGMGMLDGFEDALRDRTTEPVAVTWRVVETPGALVDAAAGADALVVDATAPVTRDVLATLSVDVVVRGGIGVDNVDLEAAAEFGVRVTNAPDYCRREVGEHALALALAATRRLPVYDRSTRAGEWAWETAAAPHRLGEATLGFVGFGAIPQAVADAAVALVDDAVAYDPYVDPAVADEYGVALAEFDAVCERTDVLLVTAPLTEETRGLVDADALARLPEDAVVVNVGRGPVVDDDALADALADGPVAAAGLDVLPTEPPVDSPLVGRDDVLVTPHAGWYSAEAAAELLDTVATTVAAVADDGVDAVEDRVRVV